MITCNLKIGLGNMLFQIATIESLAKDNHSSCYYYNIDKTYAALSKYMSKKDPFDYGKIFANFSWPRKEASFTKKMDYPFPYKKLVFEDNVCYNGYFQSEKYFLHNRQFILNLFLPSVFVLKKMEKYQSLFNKKTCSIHVRRDDYVRLSDIHPPVTVEYLQKAMKVVGPVDNYLVFSDDINWCKSVLQGDKYIFIEGNKDYVDLFLQSKCYHNIISNSSFSWWGAWLGTNKDKTIVCPKKWFGHHPVVSQENYSSDDIVCEGWVKC